MKYVIDAEVQKVINSIERLIYRERDHYNGSDRNFYKIFDGPSCSKYNYYSFEGLQFKIDRTQKNMGECTIIEPLGFGDQEKWYELNRIDDITYPIECIAHDLKAQYFNDEEDEYQALLERYDKINIIF